VSPLHTEGFRPVRYVAARQRCHFCFGAIPKASPGSSKGTRGTKAWFDPGTGPAGHVGSHTALIPTGAPWFPK
jgi:hypothetical protein